MRRPIVAVASRFSHSSSRKEDATMAASPPSPAPAPGRRSPSARYARHVLTRKPLTIGRAAQIIVTFTLAMTLIGGVVIHFADSRNAIAARLDAIEASVAQAPGEQRAE
jgi:hypothetical protein